MAFRGGCAGVADRKAKLHEMGAPVSKKKFPESRDRRAEAGKRNLLAWKAEHPGESALKHGARSRRVMRKWTDLRCRQGRELAAILAEIEDDLGPLSPGQKVILRNVGAKLAIVKQIASWAERQPSVVADGKLLPILAENFVTYTGAIERGIRALYELASRKPTRKTLDLSEYLRMKDQEKKRDAMKQTNGDGNGGGKDREEKPAAADPESEREAVPVEGEQAGKEATSGNED